MNSLLKYIKIEESLAGFKIDFPVSPFNDSNGIIYENKDYALYRHYPQYLMIRSKRWKKNIILTNNILNMKEIFNNDKIREGLLNFIEEIIRESDKARMLEELSK